MSSDQPQSEQSGSEQSGSEQVVPVESMWEEPVVVAVAATPSPSSNSIVALVLSITSWVVCPIIFAVVALIFASKAEKEINASNGSIGGGAFVSASKIISWINIGVYSALVILGLLALLLFTILGVSGSYSS